MTKLIEASKLALEALEYLCKPIADGWDAGEQKEKRDAAIEALKAALEQQGEQQLVAYVPVDSKLRDANWNHPNDTEKCDQQCQEALDARGDDKWQGLDGYWKWGFKAGWNAALAQKWEQQPVGWVDDGGIVFWRDGVPPDGVDLYAGAAPAAQPLTQEQILHCGKEVGMADSIGFMEALELGVKYAERHHGIGVRK